MKYYFAVLVAFLGLGCGECCYGLTITEPSPGSVFRPGDKVLVKVEPSANENLKAVFVFAGKLRYSTIDLSAPYEFEFVVDSDFVGADKVVASGKLVDGTIVETEIDFRVVLLSTVKLDSVTIVPSPIYITMLPASDPDAVDWATERLRISGIYSDGVERDISASAFGTIYTSSDRNIVTVDSEGTVVAQKVGRAKITVRNADKEASVDVIIVAKR